MAKRGDFVEFTDNYHRDYTIGDKRYSRYGICINDCPDSSMEIEVRTVKGIETAKYIMALSWKGWIPEELESIWEEEFGFPDDLDGEY